jgi:hypothetical protein
MLTGHSLFYLFFINNGCHELSSIDACMFPFSKLNSFECVCCTDSQMSTIDRSEVSEIIKYPVLSWQDVGWSQWSDS